MLAARFSSDPEAREVFQRLQAEEVQHASRVRLLASRYRHDPKILGTPSAQAVAELERTVVEVQEAIAQMQDGRFGRTLAQVLENVVRLEERVGSAHAEVIARTAHPDVRAFFQLLAGQDAGHARLLRKLDGKR
ncbi:MAG: hypothetical protein QM767_09425 [Anaeromyxobacter sp.]